MKLAIIGSRQITRIHIDPYIPAGATEIVSGGAKGIDTLAKDYAQRTGLPLREFLPQYQRYGRAAPLKRNEEIAKYADEAIAFWDGHSKGTDYTVRLFQKQQKKVTVFLIGEIT
mgnify:CR=1 FL=1